MKNVESGFRTRFYLLTEKFEFQLLAYTYLYFLSFIEMKKSAKLLFIFVSQISTFSTQWE